MKETKTSRGREVFTLLRGPIFLLAAYWVLVLVFGQVTEHGGLISPSGDVSIGVVLLGALVLVLRLVVFFVLPAVVLYRVGALIVDGREKTIGS